MSNRLCVSSGVPDFLCADSVSPADSVGRESDFLKRRAILRAALILPFLGVRNLSAGSEQRPSRATRGLVLNTNDLSTLDWPLLAHDAGLTTLATHITPSEVTAFLQRSEGERFLDRCAQYGIEVEHELHAVGELLPRSLFAERPELFRMDEQGNRVGDYNCCPSCSEALEIIAKSAVQTARICRSTTGRYFYWIDDGRPMCACPKCRELSYSDQATLIENAVIAALRADIDANATLAHLAYYSTMTPPEKVRPAEGIFLEFAPYERVWDKPLSDGRAGRADRMNHAETLQTLETNLKVYPVETAQVLEYWTDVSLFSGYKKPAAKLPWRPEICRSDVESYARFGIRNITAFAVYVDGEYQKNYGDLRFIGEYGAILREYLPDP